MNTRLMCGREASIGWRIAAMAAVCGLGLAARDAAAQTWVLNDIVDPPVLPDLDPTDRIAFGATVSMGKGWLVVGAPRADCQVGNVVVFNAGRLFIYKRTSGGWQYHQSFCAQTPDESANYGTSIDVSGSWFIVGAPYAFVSPSGGYHGQVEIFRLDSVSQTWSRQLVATGVANGTLGASVAIDRKTAIAGEQGVNAYRGRVRTWRLDGSTITPQAHYAPAGLQENAHYGKRVAVHSEDCEPPACLSHPDRMAVLGGQTLYIAKRSGGAWTGSQSFVAPAGSTFELWGAGLDMNRDLVSVAMSVHTASMFVDCPPGAAVRTFARPTGGNFSLSGDACPQPGLAGQFGASISVERGTNELHVGAPDFTAMATSPSVEPGVVSTFQGYPIDYVDSVAELSLAPTGPAPEVYNDRFGHSVSASAGYMAVGAPWSHVFSTHPGIGYVAIYERNTPATPFIP